MEASGETADSPRSVEFAIQTRTNIRGVSELIRWNRAVEATREGRSAEERQLIPGITPNAFYNCLFIKYLRFCSWYVYCINTIRIDFGSTGGGLNVEKT
jgi:hypothetical protein